MSNAIKRLHTTIVALTDKIQWRCYFLFRRVREERGGIEDVVKVLAAVILIVLLFRFGKTIFETIKHWVQELFKEK